MAIAEANCIGTRSPADPSTPILCQIANKLHVHAVMDTLVLVWTNPILTPCIQRLKKNELRGRSASGADLGQFDKQNCQKLSREPLPNTGHA